MRRTIDPHTTLYHHHMVFLVRYRAYWRSGRARSRTDCIPSFCNWIKRWHRYYLNCYFTMATGHRPPCRMDPLIFHSLHSVFATQDTHKEINFDCVYSMEGKAKNDERITNEKWKSLSMAIAANSSPFLSMIFSSLSLCFSSFVSTSTMRTRKHECCRNAATLCRITWIRITYIFCVLSSPLLRYRCF